MSVEKNRKTPAVVAALVIAVTVGAAVWFFRQSDDTADRQQPLWQVTAPAWTAALGGEEPPSGQDIENFANYTFGLPDQAQESALATTTSAAVAQLTSADIGDPDFDGPEQPVAHSRTPRCKDTTVLAGSVIGQRYEGTLWAKGAFLYAGDCSDGTYTRDNPAVEYAYAELVDGAWQPRRVWQTPGADERTSVFATDPGALVPTSCPPGATQVTARPVVAAAFDQLCAAAAEDGVQVTAVQGFRTRAQQEKLFDDAVAAYGSEQAAAERVSYADDSVCTSKFCQGLAVGIEPTPAATSWLTSARRCVSADGGSADPVTRDGDKQCPEGTVAVTRAQEYGFATPTAQLPGYLEYVLPAGAGPGFATEADCFPYGMTTPAVIAAVFRCRLAQAGVSASQQEQAVRTGLAVAQCASGLNPQATVFDGAYAQTPDPQFGRVVPLGGLFALAPASPSWQSGDLGDPVAAANYAAKVWLKDHSFSQFFCATGQDELLKAQAVDPRFNPDAELPPWTADW